MQLEYPAAAKILGVAARTDTSRGDSEDAHDHSLEVDSNGTGYPCPKEPGDERFPQGPASARYGQLGSYWGNLVMPVGAMKVLDRFSFDDEPGLVNVVGRVLVNPRDMKTKLYY